MESRKFVGNDIPHDLIVNLEVFVNNVVTHSLDHLPRGLRMSGLKFSCEHIGSFTHHFNVFHNGIIHHVVV